MGVKVNRQGLADHMGVSTASVDRWVREGCPVVKRGSRGVQSEYDLADVIQWYGDRRAREAGGDAVTDIDELKRRRMSAETEVAELELAKARGDVAPVRDFERTQSMLMASIRANMRNVPGRAVLQLLGCTDEAEFKRKLMAEIDLALVTSADAEIDLSDDDEIDAADDE